MIPHSIIRERIMDKIVCHNTIALLNKCIKTRIKMENGTISTSKIGTPQGSVLSPILANIVLHELPREGPFSGVPLITCQP